MRTDGGWWLDDNGPCRIVRWERQAATLVVAVDSATFERCARDPEWMSRAANPVQQTVLDDILADPEALLGDAPTEEARDWLKHTLRL